MRPFSELHYEVDNGPKFAHLSLDSRCRLPYSPRRSVHPSGIIPAPVSRGDGKLPDERARARIYDA